MAGPHRTACQPSSEAGGAIVDTGLPLFLLRRRDSIDATHYPVFHQMEGVQVCLLAIAANFFLLLQSSGALRVQPQGWAAVEGG